MREINMITVILLCVFFLPILIGAYRTFSREKIEYSIYSLLDNIVSIMGLLASIYLTRMIFIQHDAWPYTGIYEFIPATYREMLRGKDVLIYIINVPVVLFLIMLVVRPFMNLLYRAVISPLSAGLYNMLSMMNAAVRRLIGALVQVPRAAFIVFILGLLLNFYVYYFPSPVLAKWMNESKPYQILYKYAIYPVLNSSIAKKIPVLVNDSFRRTIDRVQSGDNGKLPPKKADINVIEYFNGVTLDEAIKSNAEIDATAKNAAGNEKNDKKKAYLLYKWVSQNIKYDYDKAARMSSDPKGISSGSIVAFETRKGICFDYSSLYISMCRAVGLKVRLITGLGYSGVSWGDHAWNQVYYPDENRWINVDTTFGTAANYFDRPGFDTDHKYAENQGEW